jgi:hypothetical protein
MGHLRRCHLLLVESFFLRSLRPADSKHIKIFLGIAIQKLPCGWAKIIKLWTLAIFKTPNADAFDFIAQHLMLLIRLHEANLERVDV